MDCIQSRKAILSNVATKNLTLIQIKLLQYAVLNVMMMEQAI
jgi:hypothetical protein